MLTKDLEQYLEERGILRVKAELHNGLWRAVFSSPHKIVACTGRKTLEAALAECLLKWEEQEYTGRIKTY